MVLEYVHKYTLPGPVTQRIRAEHIMAQINLPEERQLDALEEIAAEAQSAPPAGGHDGSISIEAWTALSEYLTALRVARIRQKTFKEALS